MARAGIVAIGFPAKCLSTSLGELSFVIGLSQRGRVRVVEPSEVCEPSERRLPATMACR
jgi:hypothetical protein